jgi:hypothetical protein
VQGIAGVTGPTGPQGATGPIGESVVASSEPPGTNCVAGGARLVVGATTTFACNGSNTPGYTADAGIVLSGTTFSAAFTPAGGDNGTATTVARGDHLHDARYEPKLVTTLVVSPVGTAAQNGNALRTVIDGITDNSPTKRYVIKVEAGIYDLGFNAYHGKAYVDLEGSGRASTLIQGNPADVGVVSMVGPSEIREVSVSHNGGVMVVQAVTLAGSMNGPTAARRVTASASTGTVKTVGITASGPGELIVEDSDLTASSLGGPVAGLQDADASGKLTVRRTRATCSASAVSVTECDGISSAAAATTLEQSIFTGSGGSTSVGVALAAGVSASLRGVTAIASGGNSDVGLWLQGATADVEGGVLSATAPSVGNVAEALLSVSSTFAVRGSVLQASGPSAIGVEMLTSGAGVFTGRVDHGRVLTSGTGSKLAWRVQPSPPGTEVLSVATSQVVGDATQVSAGGTLRCVGDYDATETPLGTTCN